MITHDLPFDPTYGYDLDALLKVGFPSAPGDFEAFWTQTYNMTMAQSLQWQRQVDIQRSTRFFEVSTFELSSSGAIIGGWLVVPKHVSPVRGLVVSHGYGGRSEPEVPTELDAVPTARIFPVCRGLPTQSLISRVPSDGSGHVLVGIDQRETYIHRGCVTDIWMATEALLDLYPQLIDDLCFSGGSFGGGIGAMALAFDHRFRRAHLAVPSFGHHPLRVTLECQGSGQSVRQRWLQTPRILSVLSYFDAAVAARFIRTPTLCCCALFDPAVPPPGQFAVHNAITSEKHLHLIEAGHFELPGLAEQEHQHQAAIARWFET